MSERARAHLAHVCEVARRFVEEHYPSEAAYFDAFWEGIEPRLREWEERPSEEWSPGDGVRQVAAGLGLAGAEALDLVTPIVLATVARIMALLREKRCGRCELGAAVGEVAPHHGASPDLTARLVRHLPDLCMDVVSADLGVDHAYVSMAEKPQYEVWTGRAPAFVTSIEKYESQKDTYLFWVDITKGEYTSRKQNREPLGQVGLSLLRALGKAAGTTISAGELAAMVWEKPPRGWRDSLRVELHKLRKFAVGPFDRKHIDRPLRDMILPGAGYI